MDIVRTVSKNTTALITGEIIGKLISVFVSIAFVRHLGKIELGKYSFAMAYLFFFAVLPHLCHESILGREMAVAKKEEAGRFLGDAIVLRLLLSLLAMGAAWLGFLFFESTSEIKWLIAIASLGILASFRSLFVTVFQRTMEMPVYAMANIGLTLLSALLTVSLIFAKGKVIHFMLLNVVVAFITGVFFYTLSQKRVPVQWKWNMERMRTFLTQSFPVSAGHFFDRVIARVDQLFLFSIIGISSLGLYSATVTIVEAFLFIPTALLTVLLPVLSLFFMESEKKHRESVAISGKYLLLFSLPVALFISFFSEELLLFLFGENFLEAGPILKILIWAMPLNFMLILLRHVLVSAKKQKIIFWGSFLGAALNIPLNLLFIPRFGAPGAALATTVAYAVPFACFLIDAVPRELTFRSYSSLIRLFPSLLILVCFFYFVSWNWVGSFAIACPLYAVSLFVTKGLSQEDLQLFKRALNWKHEKP